MRTDDLIFSLARDLRPVARTAMARRIAIGLAGGGVVTLALVGVLLGFRPDLAAAMHGFAFWMKWAYTLAIGATAIVAIAHLSRPEATDVRGLWLLIVPVGVIVGIAVSELARTPRTDWTQLWLGWSWSKCPFLIAGLSVPIFLGLAWSFRRLAPARLRLTGAVVGLASGAIAAVLYCLHCPEVTATFVATWYTLGILLAAGIGTVLGPKLLRW